MDKEIVNKYTFSVLGSNFEDIYYMPLRVVPDHTDVVIYANTRSISELFFYNGSINYVFNISHNHTENHSTKISGFGFENISRIGIINNYIKGSIRGVFYG